MSFDTIIHYLAYPREVPYLDVVLPFLLFFIVLYFGLRASGVIKKQQSVAVALILAAITVVPHITGTYSSCYDPVVLINNAMPQFAFMLMAAFTFVLIIAAIGVFGNLSNAWLGIISMFAIAFIAYTFFAAKSGYYMNLCSAPPQFFDFVGMVVEAGWISFALAAAVAYFVIRMIMRRGGGGVAP